MIRKHFLVKIIAMMLLILINFSFIGCFKVSRNEVKHCDVDFSSIELSGNKVRDFDTLMFSYVIPIEKCKRSKNVN